MGYQHMVTNSGVRPDGSGRFWGVSGLMNTIADARCNSGWLYGRSPDRARWSRNQAVCGNTDALDSDKCFPPQLPPSRQLDWSPVSNVTRAGQVQACA